jgi:hypothetical protein
MLETPSTRMAINASRCPGVARILPISPYILFSPMVEAIDGAVIAMQPATAVTTNVRLLIRMGAA